MKSLRFKKNFPGILVVILQAFFLPLLVIGCTSYIEARRDGKYDSSHLLMDSIDEALGEAVKSVYRIETSTTFRVGDDFSTLRIVGMAFSLDEKHLLTAKHVTAINTYQVQTPFGLMQIPLSPEAKVKETTSLVFDDGSRVPAHVIYRDEKLDFALLKAEKCVHPPSYPIGNSDDFRLVNAVILPSNFQTGLSVRTGHITQLDFIRYGPNGDVTEKNENIFGISAVVSEGDSGSPILLLRDGKIELGGVVNFIVLPARGLGYGLKINPIMERLKGREEIQNWLFPLLERRSIKR